MPKFRLSVQLDFEVEIDPDSGQSTTPEHVRELAWRRVRLEGHPEQWQVPGVKSRWSTQSFTSGTAGLAEVVEVTPEMEAEPGLIPRWHLVRKAVPPAA